MTSEISSPGAVPVARVSIVQVGFHMRQLDWPEPNWWHKLPTGEHALYAAPSHPPASAVMGEAEALREALSIALDALDEIALAGMSYGMPGVEQEVIDRWHAGRAWEFIGIAARAKQAARKTIPAAQQPDSGSVHLTEAVPTKASTEPMTLKDRMCLVECLRLSGFPQAGDEIMAMQGMLNKLIPVMDAAVSLVCSPDWDRDTDGDAELEQVLRATGFVSPHAGGSADNEVTGKMK